MKKNLQRVKKGADEKVIFGKLFAHICVGGLLATGLLAEAQQPAGTLNVKTEGTAQGDGIADDTAAIQTAFTAAKVQGKDIYFPAGTYLVSGQIDVPNGTSVFGDKSGVSLIKSDTPDTPFGEPDNDGTTIGNLSIEDMFFLNISVAFTGYAKDNIAVRRCILASDKVHTAGWFLCVLGRGDNDLVEDSIFLGGHNTGTWSMPNKFKGISNYRNTDMIIRRNIFGLDLGNLTWLDTEWEGYANWNNVEARLNTFKIEQNLPSRMGEMSGGIRLNECDGTLVDQNIFHFDLEATNVPQEGDNLDVDHIIYATQATNLEITRNWMGGQPLSPGGGLKHRDTSGPGVIAANFFNDTPLIVYSYDSDPINGFDNQLIYNNFFNITKTNRPAGKGLRLGIWFYEQDGLTGLNNKLVDNVFDVDPALFPDETDVEIWLGDGSTSPTDWIIYESNTYEGSGGLITINGNSGPYTHTSGAPPASETNPYAGLVIPDLNIPEYGESSVGTNAPAFSSDPVVEASATQDSAYSGSISDNASDADSDPMTFAKISGPSWLSMASDGALSGTPGAGDIGLNQWIVEVTDGMYTNSAALRITVDATAGGGSPGTVYLNPVDDTCVKLAKPTDNFGAATVINLRDAVDKQMDGYLKFDVQGISGDVTAIKLKLYSEHAHTLNVLAVADTSWDESTMLWGNRPAIGGLLASKAVAELAMEEIDLPTSAVTADGLVSFGLQTTSASFRNFRTKEYGSNIPELEISYTGSGNSAPDWDSTPLMENNAITDSPYSASIADNADDDESDPLSFGKASGPAWLSVATNGVLSGTPLAGDMGLNEFMVWVTDGTATNTALLEITVDSDGDWDDDGIPNSWELLHYGNETNAVASSDSDGDGFDALSEYISGFIPTNGASYPAVTGFEIVEGGSNCVISWEALEAGRAYSVVWANSLTGTFSTIESNLFYPQNSYTGTVDQIEPTGFYRIDFRLQESP